jgi:hypothetical protein
VGDEGLSESHTLFGVRGRELDGSLHHRDRCHSDHESLLRKLPHHREEAGALVAQAIRDRHPDVVEEEFSGVVRVQSDFVELPTAYEIGDDQQADPARLFVMNVFDPLTT